MTTGDKVIISGCSVRSRLIEELNGQLRNDSLTDEQLRAFLEHRNPFKRKKREASPFADEEVESTCGYPEGFLFRSAPMQAKVWEKHFPGLDSSHVPELASLERPQGAEFWGVVPKRPVVAQSYLQAQQVMLDLISRERPFDNWQEGVLTGKNHRLTEKTQAALSRLEKETPGDFLVIACQFGKLHRGRSNRRALAVFAENEFGLGVYEVASLLLTHPDRISGSGRLSVCCSGSEYDPKGAGVFESCLYFVEHSLFGQLELSSRQVGDTCERNGPVSGFLSPASV